MSTDIARAPSKDERIITALGVCIEVAEEQGVDALTLQSARQGVDRVRQLVKLRAAMTEALDLTIPSAINLQ